MIVNQWVPAAHRGDAIGDSARRGRQMLREAGHTSEIFALTIDDALRDDVRPFSDPGSRTGDITIFFDFGSRRAGPMRKSRSLKSFAGSTGVVFRVIVFQPSLR